MDSITQNSGALAGLRPAVIPSPDADFFSAFLPEIAFAAIVGILAAIAYYHFARLVSKLENPESPDKPKARPSHKHRALENLDSLNLDDSEFAEKAWRTVRTFLVDEFRNPMFPSMTVTEAVKATESIGGVEGFAYFARELEYSAAKKTREANGKLKESAKSFIQSR